MKLISEVNLNEPVKLITEDSAIPGQGKNYYISGIFMQSEVVNGNGRKYLEETLTNEVNRYTKSHILPASAWGELNHPTGPTINLDRVSHRTVELKKEGTDFIGKALIITANKPGEIAKNLIESGGRLGVSSRALGSVRMIDGVNVVQNDFHIITPADIVADPSAPEAFVNGIMEGKEWIWDNGMIVESAIYNLHKGVEQTYKPTKSKSDRLIEQIELYKIFLKNLSNTTKISIN